MRNATHGLLPLCLGMTALLLLVPGSASGARSTDEQKYFVQQAKDELRRVDSEEALRTSHCAFQGVWISANRVIVRVNDRALPLQLGDRIVSIKGVPITGGPQQIRAALVSVAPTERVAVGVIRGGSETELLVQCEDALPVYALLRRIWESVATKQFERCLESVRLLQDMRSRTYLLAQLEHDCQLYAGRILNVAHDVGLRYEARRLLIEEAQWDSAMFPSVKGQVLGDLTGFRMAGFPQYATELEAQLYAAERALGGRGNESPSSPPARSASSGSGFLVNSSGRVMTSAHVVSGAKKITVRTQDGRSVEAQVIASSEATDLAVLDTSLMATPFLSLAPARTVTVGSPVFTYGFPVAALLGSEPKFTDGTVSSLSGIQGEQTFLQISVPVQPGNSGGPLVNDKGQVVGVIAAQAAITPFLKGTGTLPQNVNWAVKAEYGALLTTLPLPQPEAKSRQEAIQQVQQAICYIEASY